MSRTNLFILIALFGFAGVAFAAPSTIFQRNVLPELTNTYDLGSTTPDQAWKHLYAQTVCLTGDTCRTTWPTGSGSPYPFTPATTFNIISSGTSTPLWLQGSPYSLFASSTSVLTYASSTAFSSSNLISGNCVQASTGGMLTTTGSACGAGGGTFPFTSNVGYNSTTTAIGFLSGLFSNSSTTLNGTINFPGIISNVLTTNSSGAVTGVASVPTSLGGTGLVNPGSLSVGALLEFDGSGGATPIAASNQYSVVQSTSGGAGFTVAAVNLASSFGVTGILPYTNGGTGTSTKVQGQLRWMGATADQGIATTSAICSGTVSCSAFTVIGTSPITLTGSASGGTGNVATSTAETPGQLAYWTSTAATPATLGKVATTTATISTGLSYSGTWGALVGGVAGNLTNTGVLSGSCTGGTTCSGTSPLAINSFPWPFTLANVFGTANANSTSTLTQFTGGLTASSTVNFGNARGAPFVWSSTVGGLSIGTTTNFFPLFLASSTVPQLAIGNSNAANLWQFMVQNDSSFVLSTSTVASTFSTSSPAILSITSNGQLSLFEAAVATSTAMTIDWNLTPNQVDVQILATAMTIGFNNASTSGMTKRVVVCNGNSAASTVTWGGLGILWSGSVAPTQTTTANKCDTYSFIVTQASSTVPSTTKVLGSYLQNF